MYVKIYQAQQTTQSLNLSSTMQPPFVMGSI